MLLYHFGSKNGLLLEVVRAVEARSRASSGSSGGGPEARPIGSFGICGNSSPTRRRGTSSASSSRSMAGRSKAMRRCGHSWWNRFASWLEANDALAAATGVPLDVARVHARLGLAVVRGLLLDLLATGDRAGVDASLEVFARRYAGSWWEAESFPADSDSPAGPPGPDSTVSPRAS